MLLLHLGDECELPTRNSEEPDFFKYSKENIKNVTKKKDMEKVVGIVGVGHLSIGSGVSWGVLAEVYMAEVKKE